MTKGREIPSDCRRSRAERICRNRCDVDTANRMQCILRQIEVDTWEPVTFR